MSTGGLPAQSLANLANDGSSVAMRWLEMLLPGGTGVQTGSQAYSLRVIEDPANHFVRLITAPLNLISVMGPARSGKSTLMNLLAGCKVTELFPTYPGMQTFTKGIYVPTRVLSLPDFSALEGGRPVTSADTSLKITFVDTEGQGAVGTGYDMNLFSPALISSRVVIYNRTGGLLVEEIIQQLGMMTQAAQRLKSADTSKPGPIFGHLVIIFNQFRLNNVDTAASLQTALMGDENQTDATSKNRNEVRALLRACFESIKVYILPDQLKEDSRDALSDGTKPFLLLDDFRPKYLDYFKILRDGLSQALTTPRELTTGIPLTGGALADFMPQFAAAINKIEPLNIPSIFEAAQNTATNRAISAFSVALSTSLDARLHDPPRATVMLGNLIDTDVNLFLAQLAQSISYMPQGIVQKAQDDARGQSATPKTAALATNLTRLRDLMAVELNNTVKRLRIDINISFQDDSLRKVSRAAAESQLNSLESSAASSYQTTGNYYDSQSFPDGWRQALSDTVNALKPPLWTQIASAWTAWASTFKAGRIDALTTFLINVGSEVGVGDVNSYSSRSSAAVQSMKLEFNAQVDGYYKWDDKEDVKTQFATLADGLAQTRRGLWEQNDTTVRTQLSALITRLLQRYDIKIQSSLVPLTEPALYATIVDESPLQTELSTFLTTNKVSATLASDTLLQFQGAISLKKYNFNSVYTKATNDYRDYLNGEFTRQVPVILAQFRNDVDAIDLNLSSAAIARDNVSTLCDSLQSQANNKFTLLTTRLGVQNAGPVSTGIIATYTLQLADGTNLAKREKLDKYDEIVGMYNKTLLAGIVTPVIDKALANSYPNDGALNGDVDAAKTNFKSRARGSDAAGSDSTTKWNDWYASIYPLVLETVRRFNAYVVPGLDGNSAATKEIQMAVIKHIYEDVANMANVLGMSYISASSFDPEAVVDKGLSQPDPMKPGSQASRTLRLNHITPPSSDLYDSGHSTCLEFFDWAVEIGDVIWGRPIITDLKPARIDTFEYPPQPTVGLVTVGVNTNETSTISDSFTWGVGAGLEASYKWGVKDSWEASVKGTFNANMSSTSTKTATTSFSTSISTQLTLPANRTNVVNQMIFNQRTSLPYTAKVRVIPKVRFADGFTKYGGGGNFVTNPRTAAIKPAFQHGDRTYGDQNFTRCDEIRADARADADPWYWRLSMERNSPYLANLLDRLADPTKYEVYVKGKWEGITGKYSVTTVTPKTTPVSLMPNF